VIVGSPGCVGRRPPRTPSDLERYRLLDFSYRPRGSTWPLQVGRTMVEVPVRGALRASDGEGLRQLALAGAGLARLSRYQVAADIRAGRLVAVLERCNPRDLVPVHAVYLGRPGRLPSRVRAVLGFLADELGRDPRLARGRAAPQA
jgi:DNA-binding transcriptional LysR family regulator